MGSALLLTGMLGGCGSGDKGSKSLPDMEPGRYVEKELECPGEWNGWMVRQLFTEDENLHLLLAKKDKEQLLLQEWKLEGNQFNEVTGTWLGKVLLPAQEWMNLKLMQDGNGVQYLFAEFAEEDIYKSHLWRSEGESALDITPEKWKVPDEEWGYYEYINGIAALDNGTLVANGSRSLDVLYGEDGSILDSEHAEDYYSENVLSDGKNIYLASVDNSNVITEIEKRPDGKRNYSEKIPFGQSSSAEIKLCVTQNGTLISAGADGIFRCEAGREDWEKLITGSETFFRCPVAGAPG